MSDNPDPEEFLYFSDGKVTVYQERNVDGIFPSLL